MNQIYPNDNNEIVMEGNLFYRYGMDQIELDGQWSLSSETSKCHFSYLLNSKQKVLPIHIDPKDLGIKENEGANLQNKNINEGNNQEKNDLNKNNNLANNNNPNVINNYDIMMKCNQYYDPNYKKYVLNLCSANIFEALLIPDYQLFKYILSFLSGEYHVPDYNCDSWVSDFYAVWNAYGIYRYYP